MVTTKRVIDRRPRTFHDDGHDEAEHLFLRMIHLRVEVPARNAPQNICAQPCQDQLNLKYIF